MLIQLIIFLTKTKIFASEINSGGKAESISIKGNTEIKCEGKESIDELIECLYDAYNIDDFADDNFDIIILESGADREIINCLQGKCKGAAKLNTISVEKLLPVIVSNKNMVKSGKEFSVTFADMFYKIVCDENGIIKVGKARKSEEAFQLDINGFAFLYLFEVSGLGNNGNEKELKEKDTMLDNLARDNKALISQLADKGKQVEDLQNRVEEYESKIIKLNQRLNDVQNELEKAKGPSNSEVFRRRLEIVKKHESKIVISSYGSFYTKGNIPKKRLDEALATINNSKIKRDNVIALYCGSNRDAATNLLIFTGDELYFDKGFKSKSNGVCLFYDDRNVKKGNFSYENILRIEQTEKIYVESSIMLNAVTIHLPNDQDITIGNIVDEVIGWKKYAAREWGVETETLMNLLKELSNVAEIE